MSDFLVVPHAHIHAEGSVSLLKKLSRQVFYFLRCITLLNTFRLGAAKTDQMQGEAV